MVKKIIAFVTSDGTLFTNELDAYKYECDCLENGQNNCFITKTNIKVEYVTMFTVSSIMNNDKRLELSNKSGVYMWFHTTERMGYVGSSDNISKRCCCFLNPNNKYGGEKIENIRKKDINNFVFLLLEEVNDATKLIERENYYVEKYDTIKNGYNTILPTENPHRICKKHTKEEKMEIERINNAKQSYNTLIKNINEWGLKIGDTLNLENWVKNYKVSNSNTDNILSFRLSCFIKNKDVVEFVDLLPLGLRIKTLIDKPRYGYRTETDTFPTSMIRYRLCDNKYLSVHNNCKGFDNIKNAIAFYVEENIREKILTFLKDENLTTIIKNMSIEDLIKLKYKDSNKIIDFLHNEYELKKVG